MLLQEEKMKNNKTNNTKMDIKCDGTHWNINRDHYHEGATYDGGFDVSLIVNHTLLFSREMYDVQTGVHRKIEIKFHTNGRLTVDHIENGEIIDRQKRYVEMPIDGTLTLVCNKDDIFQCYAFYRPKSLENKLAVLKLKSIKAKPDKFFIVQDNHWKIRESYLNEQGQTENIIVSIFTNGGVHVTVPSDGYIYIDFDSELPLENRYALIRKGKYDNGLLYLNGGMLTDALMKEIQSNREPIRLQVNNKEENKS